MVTVSLETDPEIGNHAVVCLHIRRCTHYTDSSEETKYQPLCLGPSYIPMRSR